MHTVLFHEINKVLKWRENLRQRLDSKVKPFFLMIAFRNSVSISFKAMNNVCLLGMSMKGGESGSVFDHCGPFHLVAENEMMMRNE